MSFSYNPYNHIEVLHKPHGNYRLHCHGCGKVWGDWVGAVTAEYMFKEMATHIEKSHARSRADFAGWSDE